jgi:two-component system LytT family response regulator
MLLHRMIEKQEGFQVVSESGNFAEAVTDFSKYRPDVVFVDIDLGGASGLECAKVLTEWDPKLKVIFATAHSEYMANAFEIYAFDYLVKPFNMERLAKTLAKVRTVVGTEEAAAGAGVGATAMSSGNMVPSPAPAGAMGLGAAAPGESRDETDHQQAEIYKDKLLIKGKDQVILVDKKDIIMIERTGNATNIVTKEENFQTSVSLGDIEKKLNASEFMRCHKSYIINISMIRKMEPYGRWTFVVKLKGTDATALITAQCYETLKEMFS